MCFLSFWVGLLPAGAQTIKLGTVAPEGSPWHEAVLDLAEEWKTISNGKVLLKIYPGGRAGDEPDMLRKMRIGQLHAAALTSVGLISVVPDIEAISFPMQVRTDEEMEILFREVGPQLEAQLEEAGFKVLTWSFAGWVYFFAQNPVATVDDLRKEKLFFWGSDTKYVELLKQLGYSPVPLAVTDLLPSLQTGLVTSFAAPPAAALAFQWFGLAKNMTDIKWQALPSVIVVSNRQWQRVPETFRTELEAAARRAGLELSKRTRKLDNEAIAAMEEHGLRVVPVTPAAEKDWQDMIDTHGLPVFVGERFSADIHKAVQSALRDYRATLSHD